MSKIAAPHWNPSPAQDEQEPPFKPLGREEAKALRSKLASVSPWRVIAFQAAVACVVALAAYAIGGKASIGWSAAYGGLAVIIPAIVFARGLTSRLSSVNAGSAMMGFFLWEAVKIGLTVAMLFAAPRWVPELSWPALLAGLVVTMKSVWVMLWMQPKTGAASAP
jgi:ATP synthase protein I